MTIEHHIIDLALLAIVLIIAPFVAYREMRSLKDLAATGQVPDRVGQYRLTLMVQWLVAGALLVGWFLVGRSVADIGLVPVASGWQWVVIAAAAVITVAVVLYNRRLESQPEQLAEVRNQLGDLAVMMPRTAVEVRWFDAMSVTAGVCEEIVYRGMLMTLFSGLVGLWPAVLISSVIFGLGHAYQGASGVLRTGLVGLALALVVLGTGSLYMAIVMHAVLDLVQGRMLAVALRQEPVPAVLPG